MIENCDHSTEFIVQKSKENNKFLGSRKKSKFVVQCNRWENYENRFENVSKTLHDNKITLWFSWSAAKIA